MHDLGALECLARNTRFIWPMFVHRPRVRAWTFDRRRLHGLGAYGGSLDRCFSAAWYRCYAGGKGASLTVLLVNFFEKKLQGSQHVLLTTLHWSHTGTASDILNASGEERANALPQEDALRLTQSTRGRRRTLTVIWTWWKCKLPGGAQTSVRRPRRVRSRAQRKGVMRCSQKEFQCVTTEISSVRCLGRILRAFGRTPVVCSRSRKETCFAETCSVARPSVHRSLPKVRWLRTGQLWSRIYLLCKRPVLRGVVDTLTRPFWTKLQRMIRSSKEASEVKTLHGFILLRLDIVLSNSRRHYDGRCVRSVVEDWNASFRVRERKEGMNLDCPVGSESSLSTKTTTAPSRMVTWLH